MTFGARLRAAMDARGPLCAGIDPHTALLRDWGLPDTVAGLERFALTAAEAIAPVVAAVKPQSAFFERFGSRGIEVLERTIRSCREAGAVVVLDVKRGDIGSTAQHYATEAFERYRADAVTLNPYLGRDSIQPFLDRADKGVILLCHTSNPGAADLQDLIVESTNGERLPLYQHLARTIARDWNANGNCALVTGATWPEQLAQVRVLVGDMPLLVPGIGAQGGDVEAVLRHGRTADGTGLMISSSRAILYAGDGEDFDAAARKATETLRDQINRCRA